MNNFVQACLEKGGKIKPILLPSSVTGGLGLMNPSLYYRKDKKVLAGILRQVNYTFYHSEKKLFQHPYGPLTYIHPQDDIHLRTWNWYIEFDENLNLTRANKIDTSRFDNYEPQWDFVGLEDARLFEWDGKLYTSGVRRDTTPNGVGRMELCEIEVEENKVTEISRVRIETPVDPDSYCEKNWMPVLDNPYQYVKWSNPTEVVKVNPHEGTSEVVKLTKGFSLNRDIRGGSQVLRLGDRYVALTHEVWLYKSEAGRKDAIYWHRFIEWDSDWNVTRISRDFHFMEADVEFSIGMVFLDDNAYITFGFQDNAAFILQTDIEHINQMLDEGPPVQYL